MTDIDRAVASDWFARREAEADFAQRKPELVEHPLLRNLPPELAQAFVGLIAPVQPAPTNEEQS